MINFEIARAHACARVLACKTAFFKNSARARAARVLSVRVPRAHAFRTRRGRTLLLLMSQAFAHYVRFGDSIFLNILNIFSSHLPKKE